ncbi:hypothetical protein BH23GEM9_BH23GEM9_23400 [soil metagenome]
MTNRRARAAGHGASDSPLGAPYEVSEGAATPRIVGGTFGLPSRPEARATTPPLAGGRHVLFVNARSALYTLLDWIGCKRVWVPSYLCEALLTPLARRAVDVQYYPVDRKLEIADDAWLDQVHDSDAVVLIDYFGFPVEASWIEAVRGRGAHVIEDAAMALLTAGVGRDADFTIYSPRKFVGVPDGGILVIGDRVQLLAEPVLTEPPAAWWSRAVDATDRRTRFDEGDDDRGWLELYQQVEAEAPTGLFAMSRLSRALLYEGFDYEAIAERRITNFRLLVTLLADVAVFGSLPDGVVPLGFPVRVADRDSIQRELFRNEVFPPVHWSLPAEVHSTFAESHRLSREILTLPCDQRYGRDDMERVARLVREACG